MDGKYSGANMQKGSDLLDELGLIFIVGLKNGNICMHFGFKACNGSGRFQAFQLQRRTIL